MRRMSFDDGVISTCMVPEQEHRAFVRELQSFLPNAEDGGRVFAASIEPASWVEVATSVSTWGRLSTVTARALRPGRRSAATIRL